MNSAGKEPFEDAVDSHSFSTLINQDDISRLLNHQEDHLSRLEKTNALLQTANELSAQRFSSMVSQLRGNVRCLVSIKRELNLVLKRTASIKKTLAKQYPAEFAKSAHDHETVWEIQLDAEIIDPPPHRSAIPSRTMAPLPE